MGGGEASVRWLMLASLSLLPWSASSPLPPSLPGRCWSSPVRGVAEDPNRREVEYASDDILGETSTVPMSWHSWLRHGRVHAPTPDELEAEEQARLALKSRVATINAADQKLRLQELAERHLQESAAGSSRGDGDAGGHAGFEDRANLERERDQHGGVSRWQQQGSGVAGGHQQ